MAEPGTQSPSPDSPGGTSKETEIKLTNVTRASLGELLEDYRDFLRLRGVQEWPKEHRYTKRLRQLNRQSNAN